MSCMQAACTDKLLCNMLRRAAMQMNHTCMYMHAQTTCKYCTSRMKCIVINVKSGPRFNSSITHVQSKPNLIRAVARYEAKIHFW